MQNQVVGSGTAVVNGKATVLAGCDTRCERHCLRRDDGLKFRWQLSADSGHCPYFIPERR